MLQSHLQFGLPLTPDVKRPRHLVLLLLCHYLVYGAGYVLYVLALKPLIKNPYYGPLSLIKNHNT